MANVVHLKNWVVLYSSRHKSEVHGFMDTMNTAGRSVGMTVSIYIYTHTHPPPHL